MPGIALDSKTTVSLFRFRAWGSVWFQENLVFLDITFTDGLLQPFSFMAWKISLLAFQLCCSHLQSLYFAWRVDRALHYLPANIVTNKKDHKSFFPPSSLLNFLPIFFCSRGNFPSNFARFNPSSYVDPVSFLFFSSSFSFCWNEQGTTIYYLAYELLLPEKKRGGFLSAV